MKKPLLLPVLMILAGVLPNLLWPEDVRIGKISIVSNYKTRDFIIRQELDFSEGAVYPEADLAARLTNSRQNLFNLGIFADIRFTIATNSSNASDVIAEVEDKWTLFPLPYYYFDNKIGNVFGFFCNEKNFFGLNQELNLNLLYQTGTDKKLVSFSYNYPRILGSYFLLNAKLTYMDFLDAQYSDQVQTYQARTTSWNVDGRITYQVIKTGWPLTLGASTTLQMITNKILFNAAGKVPDNLTAWYLSLGLEQGVVNRKTGIAWGDNNNFWAGISPLDGSFLVKFQLAKYFMVSDKSVFAYQLNGRISPALDQPLDSGDVRGIKLGEIRGNYVFYGNVEFRPYLFTITWPTEMYFYTPVFLDFGNGTIGGSSFDVSKTLYTAGLGIRLYPKYIGGNKTGIRLDLGVNIPHLAGGFSFWNYFYIALDVQDMF